MKLLYSVVVHYALSCDNWSIASESDSIVSMQSASPINYLLKCQKLPPQKTQNEMEYMSKDDY